MNRNSDKNIHKLRLVSMYLIALIFLRLSLHTVVTDLKVKKAPKLKKKKKTEQGEGN